MKGQLATIISLLKNNKTKKKIAYIITSDEEIGGYCCKEILKEYTAELAVIPDASSNFNLVVEEKGLLQLELTSYGTTAHASEPYKGDNAIIKLIDLYNELLKIYSKPKKDEFKTTINLSKLNGEEAVNMVPGTAKMTLDIRFEKSDSIDSILDNVNKLKKDIKVKVLTTAAMRFFIWNFLKQKKNILRRSAVDKRKAKKRLPPADRPIRLCWMIFWAIVSIPCRILA